MFRFDLKLSPCFFSVKFDVTFPHVLIVTSAFGIRDAVVSRNHWCGILYSMEGKSVKLKAS